MKKFINYKSHWFWFILMVTIYTIYDYLEHILRPGSTFEAHPVNWFLFSAGAIATFFTFLLGFNQLFEKLFKKQHLIFEVIAVGIWVITYLYFIGPLLNKLFWPYDELYFSFKFSGFFIILGIYVLIRIVIGQLIKRSIKAKEKNP